MGGQDGIRGYLVQAIIAVMQSLSHQDWEFVALEPDEANQKVDIQWWDAEGKATVYQVKSSINNFDKGEILGILNDLVADVPKAANYTLTLLGTYSGDTVKFFNAFDQQDTTALGKFAGLFDFKDQITVQLKMLEVSALKEQVENKVYAFLSGYGYVVPHTVTELIALGLTAQFTRFATEGTKVSRIEFRENIFNWMRYNYPKQLRKEQERLSLATYDDQQLDTSGSYHASLRLNERLLDDRFSTLKADILLLIGEIDDIKLPATTTQVDRNHPNRLSYISLLPIGSDLPAAMDAEDIAAIRQQVTEYFQTGLPPDFFQVGQAMRPQMKTMMDFMGRGVRFTGSADEVKKADLLHDLKWNLKKLADLTGSWQQLCGFSILPLVIVNDGDGLQTNIELQLSFPTGVLVLHKETFPKPEYNSNMEFFSYPAGHLQKLFTMPPDSVVKAYDYREIPPLELPMFDPFFGKSKEQYDWSLNSALQWVFDYKIYTNVPGQQILSCQFKGIKPKAVMALPSLCMVKSDVPFELNYHFKSDQSGTTKGVLKIF